MDRQELVEKTVSLYSDSGWKKYFAKFRLWHAPFIEVESLVPKKGYILDLGCGEGLFANYLAMSSSNRKIFGIDLDKKRVSQANKGLKNTKFIHGDVTKVDLPKTDVVIMFHLLHHLPSLKSQEDLIKIVKSKLKKTGLLIIVEAEPQLSFKYFLAWFTDHFLVAWLFEQRFYSPIYFRKTSQWKKLLKEMGFKTKSYSAQKNKPFSHVILTARN